MIWVLAAVVVILWLAVSNQSCRIDGLERKLGRGPRW